MYKKIIKKAIAVMLSVLMMSSLAFTAMAQEDTDPVKSKLEGKKILFVGDSITRSYEKIGWPGRIAELFGTISTNAGVADASVSTVVPDNRIITQLLENQDNEYDYVIMHGGVNDAWQLAPVGTISDSFEVEDFDISTYAGALEELFYNAFKHFDGAKLGFIVNYSRPNAKDKPLINMSEYFAMAKQVCEKWGISYFDMYWGTVNVDGEELAISSELLLSGEDTHFKTDPYPKGDIHIGPSGYDLISPHIGEWISTIEHNEYHGTYNNPLAGKSALFIGDSITEAPDDGKIGWGGRIADKNGMTYLNAGSSGATLSTVKSNRVITKFNENRRNNYDYVIMQGGVNDAMSSAPIGEVSATFEVADFDTATFAGGLEELFYNVRKYHADAALGYIINYATPNSEKGGNTKDMSAYFEVAKKVCDKWNIPYLDLYSGTVEEDGKTLSYSYDILKVNTGEYMNNNDATEVHINSLGYDVIAPYIGEWMKTLKPLEGEECPLADWAERTPINGDFEIGLVGTDVYGWHMESMASDGKETAPTKNYQKHYSFETVMGKNGKVAQLSKNGSGYVALVSEKVTVTGGETYELSYDYRKSAYEAIAETSCDYLGVRPLIREYKADGTLINRVQLTHHENKDNKVSEEIADYHDAFVTNSETDYIEVCFWVGGQVGMTCTVEFDNINVKAVNPYINGGFDAVTYEADGGRTADVAGPKGWKFVTTNYLGTISGKGTHLANYTATVVTENGNKVMKLSSALETGYCQGYALANSSSFAVEANKLYNVNFNMKCDITGAKADDVKVIMTFWDQDGSEIGERAVENLGSCSRPWTFKTVQFNAPEGAVSAAVGFWIGDANADYTTIDFYIDDVSVNSVTDKLGFVKETTNVNGAPRGDSRDFTPYWDINRVNDGAEHRNALMLSVTNGSQSYGGVTFFSKPISVTAGENYKCSFDYKLKGNLHMYNSGKKPYVTSFVVYYLDKDGNRLAEDGSAATAPHKLFSLGDKDTVDWMYSGVKEVTIPENAVAIQYGLIIGSQARGTQDNLKYYFDHIVFEKSAEFDDVRSVGHVFENYVADGNATCTENGTETGTCVCGKTNTRKDADSKLDHTYENYASNNDATCTANGTETGTCACGKTDTREDADSKLDHIFENYVFNNDAKCGIDGTKTAVCSNGCGEKETIPAKGTALKHKFTNYIYNKDATCEADGTKTAVCSNGCGETETIAAKGTAKGHSHVASVGTAATCGKYGVMNYKCACGDSYTKPIAKTNAHKNVTVRTKKATLTTNGTLTTKCSVCGTPSKTTAIAKIASVTTTSKVTYSGKTKKPSVKVKDAKGKVISSSNYTLKYASGRKNYGKYKITVTFKGNYSGSKVIYFEIVPKNSKISKLTAAKKSLKVKISKQKSASGYQIQYSTSKTFKSAKTVTLKKNSLTSKTISKLKAKKTYYVRVRTYKTYKGKKYYSAWSTVKSMKTKK